MGGRKVKQVGKAIWKKSMSKVKGYMTCFTRGRNTVLIIICALSMLSHSAIHKVKTELFYRSNSVSFMDGWFIYDAMGNRILLR